MMIIVRLIVSIESLMNFLLNKLIFIVKDSILNPAVLMKIYKLSKI